MTFRKYSIQWLIVTIVFGILAFACNRFAPTHTLWPFALSFLYIGVLLLLVGKMIIDELGKKA